MSSKINTPKEYDDVLEMLARKAIKPNAQFLEVGCFRGFGSLVIAKVAKECDGHLECLDIWESPHEYKIFIDNIANSGLDSCISHIREDSMTGISKVSGKKDFIYIDGNHTYDIVKSDILNSLKLLNEGGILCGHDFRGNYEDYDSKWLEEKKNSPRELESGERVFPGIILAVQEIFGNDIIFHKDIWEVSSEFFTKEI